MRNFIELEVDSVLDANLPHTPWMVADLYDDDITEVKQPYESEREVGLWSRETLGQAMNLFNANIECLVSDLEPNFDQHISNVAGCWTPVTRMPKNRHQHTSAVDLDAHPGHVEMVVIGAQPFPLHQLVRNLKHPPCRPAERKIAAICRPFHQSTSGSCTSSTLPARCATSSSFLPVLPSSSTLQSYCIMSSFPSALPLCPFQVCGGDLHRFLTSVMHRPWMVMAICW